MHFMTLCATWSLYHVALDHPQSRFWLPKMIWTWIFWFLFGVHSYLSTRSFYTSLPHHLNLNKWPTFIPKRRQLRIDIVLEYLQRHFIAQYCKYILLRSVGENMTWTNLCAKYTISAISLTIVLHNFQIDIRWIDTASFHSFRALLNNFASLATALTYFFSLGISKESALA